MDGPASGPGHDLTRSVPRSRVRAPRAVGETRSLAGFSVLVTAERRAEDFAAGLARRGAQVVAAPVTGTVFREDDPALVTVTRMLLDAPPDLVVVTTAVGLRGWLASAQRDGRAAALLALLGTTPLLARGPKARAAIRAAGLVESWVAATETTAAVVDHVLADGAPPVAGLRIAVQQHGGSVPPGGAPLTDPALARLAAAGAEVVVVPVYRVGPPADAGLVAGAIGLVARRHVDAVVFSSAPGAQAFLDAAAAHGRYDDVIEAMRRDVLPAAIGPVTAEPLVAAGLVPMLPERYRLPILVRAVAQALTSEHVREVRTPGGVLRLAGPLVSLGGTPLPVSPVPLAILRVLSRHAGAVVPRSELLQAMPAAGDLHAVEVAVARLRTAIGLHGMVETVVGEGYRLATAGDGGGPGDGPGAAADPGAGTQHTGTHAVG